LTSSLLTNKSKRYHLLQICKNVSYESVTNPSFYIEIGAPQKQQSKGII
jgi:hypothetical protein